MTTLTAAKDTAAAVIEEHLADLVALSHSVHSTPELCFNETVSARAVADALRAGGLSVEEGVYDIPTAFESAFGLRGSRGGRLRRIRRPARCRPRLRAQHHRRRRGGGRASPGGRG